MQTNHTKATTKKQKRRLKNLRQQEQRRINEIKRQKRYTQERRQLKPKIASKDPQPAPRGAAYFVSEMWQNLRLDLSLDKVGIIKEGFAYSTTFLLVIMMGITGAPSLNQLAALVPQDLTIMTIFNLQQLDENQLYRGLSTVEIPQYKAWCIELLRALQKNPLTAALKNGVVSGDTTQIAKPYSKKMPAVIIIYSHTEKRFIRGMEAITTHYSDDQKDYPLNFDF